MDNYERLMNAYDQYFKDIDKIYLVFNQIDIAQSKCDWWTCYKCLNKIKAMRSAANKRMSKAKEKYPVLV